MWYNYRRGVRLEKPSFGRLMSFRLRPAPRAIWLGSAWAALCGAVSSGGLEFSGQCLLYLVLTLLLADPLLGNIWSILAATDWAPSPVEDEGSVDLPALPYMAPGSLSHRLLTWLNQTLTWWLAAFWPRWGTSLVGLLVTSILALALAALLGRGPAFLVLISFVLLASRVLLLGRPVMGGPLLRASLEIGLAWMIGYTAFYALPASQSRLAVADWLHQSWEPSLLAGLYTLTYYACLTLEERLSRGIALLNATQISAMALLVFVKRPILTGIVGLMLLPQMLLQPLLRRHGDRPWYLRQTQLFMMGGMMAAAVGCS